MFCYESCTCSCGQSYAPFDKTINSETRFAWSLRLLTHSNIGWYSDKSICDEHLIQGWGLSKKIGVYVLWHKDDYCPRHELFHLRALYVGKGHVERRLLNHWKNKDYSDEMLVYFTFLEMPNRQAKYCEQLLLDTFKVYSNRAENPGTQRLCTHFTQCEVD